MPGRVLAQPRMLELLRAANPGRRADSRRTWDAIAVEFVRRADWATGAITAPHEVVAADAGRSCERAGFSHDTVGRFVAAAISAGVLVCPAGLGGRSRRALRGARNQCPTYFVVDPNAPDPVDSAPDLRTPPSHVSETVQVVGTHSLYKGPNFPIFANFDATAVPATATAIAEAARYMRSRLLAGAVPNWRMAAMMRTQFEAGFSPAELVRRACLTPDGTDRQPLPTDDAGRAAALARSPHRRVSDMLLGMIGGRLRQWRQVPPPAPRRATPPPVRDEPAPTPAPTRPPAAALAEFARSGLLAGALRSACGTA